MKDMADHILVVEDEDAIAEVLVFALESEGFQVTWVNTAGKGYDAIQAEPVDLAVFDVGLPDETGFELCKRVRKTSDLPVIFLTARKEEIDRIVGLEIGADDYVTKPFSPREVSARIKTILRRTRANYGQQPSALEVSQAAFEADDEKKTVHYYGKLLSLTLYEYRILSLLISQPDRIFSRAQLMDAAWDEPEAAFDRAVDTHIKGLRAKLRSVKESIDPIKTHRGLGYSLHIPT